MTDKIPLHDQIEEIRLAHTRALALRAGRSITEKRPKDQVARSAVNLHAAMKTLEWMLANEDALREFHAAKQKEKTNA